MRHRRLRSVLAVANQLGLAAIGVELSRKRAQRARNLQLRVEGAPPQSP